VQQGLFNFSQYQLIQVIHILTVQLSKIVLQCLFNRVTQGFLSYLILRVNGRNGQYVRIYALFEHSSVSSLFLLRKIFEVCLQRLQLFAGILNGVECAPKLVIWSMFLKIPGDVFTRDSVPFCLTVKVMQFPNVRTKQALNL
ncbi:hypothetical protein AN687_28760, partial [Klebsiella variicola]